MNPQPHNNESVPYKLPEVQVDTADIDKTQENPFVKGTSENQVAQAIERGNSGAPTLAAASNTPMTPIAMPLSADAGMGAATIPTKIQVSTDDLHAKDGDIIEKAWVVKAKAIVASTKDDPYLQTNAIKRVKADYQLKRFNNKLKIENE